MRPNLLNEIEISKNASNSQDEIASPKLGMILLPISELLEGTPFRVQALIMTMFW